MRVFVTGATGFLGGRLTQKLLERGDEVIALVRRDVDLGAARTVRGDLSDRDALRDAMRGCDAVFHVAVRYEVGIPAREGNAMYDVNVRGTENVLDAAADLPRIVHVSTVNVFGNTRGRIVDETYVRRSPTSASPRCTSTTPRTGSCSCTTAAASASRTCSAARSPGWAR